MAKYDYRAIDANGKVKKGTIEANSEDTAKSKLRAEGLNITEFGDSKDISISLGKKGVKNKVRHLTLFCQRCIFIFTVASVNLQRRCSLTDQGRK